MMNENFFASNPTNDKRHSGTFSAPSYNVQADDLNVGFWNLVGNVLVDQEDIIQ